MSFFSRQRSNLKFLRHQAFSDTCCPSWWGTPLCSFHGLQLAVHMCIWPGHSWESALGSALRGFFSETLDKVGAPHGGSGLHTSWGLCVVQLPPCMKWSVLRLHPSHSEVRLPCRLEPQLGNPFSFLFCLFNCGKLIKWTKITVFSIEPSGSIHIYTGQPLPLSTAGTFSKPRQKLHSSYIVTASPCPRLWKPLFSSVLVV